MSKHNRSEDWRGRRWFVARATELLTLFLLGLGRGGLVERLHTLLGQDLADAVLALLDRRLGSQEALLGVLGVLVLGLRAGAEVAELSRLARLLRVLADGLVDRSVQACNTQTRHS